MGRRKDRLLFCGLTSSAYISPLLMIISLLTNYWIYSSEKVITMTTVVSEITQAIGSSSIIRIVPLEYTEANYGLWKMCKIRDTSRIRDCELIRNFQGSDSEIGDTIKKQIDNCIIPIMIALCIMITSVILHSYALMKKKQYYLFLLSGCLVIFAGLSSLTGLIIFISAVNGAVDNKLAKNNRSREEEPPFRYGYGISFYCAVLSFLFQEINGICNIYWYIGYHKRKRFQNLRKSQTSLSNNVNDNLRIIPNNSKIDKFSKSNNLKSNIKIIITDETELNPTNELVEQIETNNPFEIDQQDYETKEENGETFQEYDKPPTVLSPIPNNQTKKNEKRKLTKNNSLMILSSPESFDDSYVSSSISSFSSSTSTLKVKSDESTSDNQDNNTHVPEEPLKLIVEESDDFNELKAKFYKLDTNSKSSFLKINNETDNNNKRIPLNQIKHLKFCNCNPSLEQINVRHHSDINSFKKFNKQAPLNFKKNSSNYNNQSFSITNESNYAKQMSCRSKSGHNFRIQQYPYFITLPIYKLDEEEIVKEKRQQLRPNIPLNRTKIKHHKTANLSVAMINAANAAALATENYIHNRHNNIAYSNLNHRNFYNFKTMPNLFIIDDNSIQNEIGVLRKPHLENEPKLINNKNHRVYRIRKRTPLLKQSSYNSALKRTDTFFSPPGPASSTEERRISALNWQSEARYSWGNKINISNSNDAHYFKLKRTTSV